MLLTKQMNDAPDSLTKLERSVLLALSDDHPEREILLSQIESATVVERDYTGVGLYTKLAVDPEVPKLAAAKRFLEDCLMLELNHPDLEAGAGVILWLDDAKIDTLEFYAFTGDWPKDETAFKINKANPSPELT